MPWLTERMLVALRRLVRLDNEDKMLDHFHQNPRTIVPQHQIWKFEIILHHGGYWIGIIIIRFTSTESRDFFYRLLSSWTIWPFVFESGIRRSIFLKWLIVHRRSNLQPWWSIQFSKLARMATEQLACHSRTWIPTSLQCQCLGWYRSQSNYWTMHSSNLPDWKCSHNFLE